MKRKSLFLLLMTIMMVLLTGCWSKKELTDLAFVSAMGIDKTKDGQYELTFQIINPGNVSGLQSGGIPSPPVTIYAASGKNLVEASRRASARISRRLYYAHTNLIVIGEKLAREEGINIIIDAIDRDSEFRVTTSLVIANKSSAADLVKALTPVDKIPANKIMKTLEFTQRKWGENLKVSFQEVMKELESPGGEALISGFRLVGDPQQAKKLANLQQSAPEATLRASGIAVFKNGKLVDWLYNKQAKGSVWILDKIQGTDINVDWKEKKEALAYQTVRQKTDVSVKMTKGKPRVSVHARVEGDLGEMEVPLDIQKPSVLKKVEKVVGQEIKKELNMAIKQAQSDKVDIFGFGEALERKRPNQWAKLQSEWDDVYFPKLDVDVTVEAYIRRTGLRNKSFLSSIKEKQQ